MKKYFKVVIILFTFLFVCACNRNENDYNTKIVSSATSPSYSRSNENENVLRANVMIFNNNYSSFLGLKYEENNSYGSGVIYKSDSKYYYVLTNNHVISYDYSYNQHDIYIEDYYSNKYKCEIVYSDINYDLAIVRFEKKTELNVLHIEEDSVDVRESVRSMGNPKSVKNVISKGMVNCFSYITLDNEKSKVDFEVIVHSAEIAGGSSGGALLNRNNEIIGITFAGVFDNKGNFITGYAIPSARIIEFLNS
jgi:S1-C subfamily serine protease